VVALLAGDREGAARDNAFAAGRRLPDGQKWLLPFEAEQYFTTDPPAFLWKASFQMAPLIWVVGRDRFRNGIASIQMRVLSLLPVANKTGHGLNQAVSSAT
jgi:hypothetical protein